MKFLTIFSLILEINEDSLSVKIAAPPVDGEANKELIKYMTRLLKLKSGDVVLDTVIQLNLFLLKHIYALIDTCFFKLQISLCVKNFNYFFY
jgi:hypothetical protein